MQFEISCDPITEQCYEYCEDEACQEPWYYKYATTKASTLKDYCGLDINLCEEVENCQSNELACTIDYCESGDTRCENITSADVNVTFNMICHYFKSSNSFNFNSRPTTTPVLFPLTGSTGFTGRSLIFK